MVLCTLSLVNLLLEVNQKACKNPNDMELPDLKKFQIHTSSLKASFKERKISDHTYLLQESLVQCSQNKRILQLPELSQLRKVGKVPTSLTPKESTWSMHFVLLLKRGLRLKFWTKFGFRLKLGLACEMKGKHFLCQLLLLIRKPLQR